MGNKLLLCSCVPEMGTFCHVAHLWWLHPSCMLGQACCPMVDPHELCLNSFMLTQLQVICMNVVQATLHTLFPSGVLCCWKHNGRTAVIVTGTVRGTNSI